MIPGAWGTPLSATLSVRARRQVVERSGADPHPHAFEFAPLESLQDGLLTHTQRQRGALEGSHPAGVDSHSHSSPASAGHTVRTVAAPAAAGAPRVAHPSANPFGWPRSVAGWPRTAPTRCLVPSLTTGRHRRCGRRCPPRIRALVASVAPLPLCLRPDEASPAESGEAFGADDPDSA